MRRCLELARRAAGNGETAVGALVVGNGDVIGEGWESTRRTLDPSAHAEVEAIRSACRREQSLTLSGCTLYTTVEPCVLCGYAIRRCAIARIVYGVEAGALGAITSRYAIASDGDVAGWPAPPEVIPSILAEDCRMLLRRR
jgi:tRNA(adenine34) deaminase